MSSVCPCCGQIVGRGGTGATDPAFSVPLLHDEFQKLMDAALKAQREAFIYKCSLKFNLDHHQGKEYILKSDLEAILSASIEDK